MIMAMTICIFWSICRPSRPSLYPLFRRGCIISLVGEKAVRLNDILFGLSVGLSLEYILTTSSEMAPKSVFFLRRQWSRRDSVRCIGVP
jgi:hypothetical protein